MKRMLGMSFEQGMKVLEAFRSHTGDLSVRIQDDLLAGLHTGVAQSDAIKRTVRTGAE